MERVASRTSKRIVRVGDHRVGDGRRTLIVAEAGVNHDGDVEKALRLVDVAADAGADMVKFQVFSAAELTTRDAATAAYQDATGAMSQRELLERLELDDDAFARISAYCRRRSIEFLATPFGIRDVDRLLTFGAHAVKIASGDIDNLPLLQRAAATGLPLIVSTGTATHGEIRDAVSRLVVCGARTRLILLHCVSAYPTPLSAANLRRIGALRAAFDVPVGFSDHTRSTAIGGWAVAAGACALEKHFTLDNTTPGPDHAMSLEPEELAAYVSAVRDAESARGDGRIDAAAIEHDVRNVARKSVVAREDIPAGVELTEAMLTMKRAGGGIPPRDLDALFGRRLRRRVAADTPLNWDDFA